MDENKDEAQGTGIPNGGTAQEPGSQTPAVDEGAALPEEQSGPEPQDEEDETSEAEA